MASCSAPLRDAPHNYDLVAQLWIYGPDGARTVRQVIALNEVATGIRNFPVAT